MLYYTPTDQDMIAQADLFASTKHAGQSRKDGTPYIHHPRFVSALAGYWAQQLFDEPPPDDLHTFTRLGRIRVAGLCHDLVEDQNVTWDTLCLMFGAQVANQVLTLSNDKSIDDRDLRNSEYCKVLAAASEDEQVTKLADLYHNAVSVTPNPKFGAGWVRKAWPMLHSLHKMKGTIYYAQTEQVILLREEMSRGTNVSRERMEPHGHCANKEGRPAGCSA